MPLVERLQDFLHLNINEIVNQADNKNDVISELIFDIEKQCGRLDYMLIQADEKQKLSLIDLENSKAIALSLEEKARSAIEASDEKLAKEILLEKYHADEKVKDFNLIYITLSAQTSQLNEQFETLKVKLHEAKAMQRDLDTNFRLHNKAVDCDLNCKECFKTKEVLDAELDRLMDEIKRNHNLM